MRSVVGWLLGVFLSVGLAIDASAQSQAPFLVTARPSDGGGVRLEFSASSPPATGFSRQQLGLVTGASYNRAPLEARVPSGQDFFSLSSTLPKDCATVENFPPPSRDLKITYAVNLSPTDESATAFLINAPNDCVVNLIRRDDADPFSGEVTLETADCTGTATGRCFSAPSPSNFKPLLYSLVGDVDGVRRNLGNLVLEGNSTFALGFPFQTIFKWSL